MRYQERDVSRAWLEAISMETGKQHDNGTYSYILHETTSYTSRAISILDYRS